MTPVRVTFEPATTVGEEGVLVMARSAVPATPTVVMATAVLLARLGSVVPEVMLATSTICVPLEVPAATVTTTVKVPEVLAEKMPEVVLQEMAPATPTAGVVQVQPAGMMMEEKVVLAGVFSVKTAATASRGPLLATVFLMVRLPP